MRLLGLLCVAAGIVAAVATRQPAPRRKPWSAMTPAEQFVSLLERDGLFLAPRQSEDRA